MCGLTQMDEALSQFLEPQDPQGSRQARLQIKVLQPRHNKQNIAGRRKENPASGVCGHDPAVFELDLKRYVLG